MVPGASSDRWKRRQAADPWVRKAQADGWRSRAVYKLIEIDEKFRLFKSGCTVVDLGAAPGGWSQYASARAGRTGRVIAVDILDMDSIEGVELIRGDFTEYVVMQQLLDTLGDGRADLVISDLAPNMTGMRTVDQPRSMHLAELALDIAERVLRPHGDFVCKLFQGTGFEDFTTAVRRRFETVKHVKPRASRTGSREMYLVAGNFRI